MISVTKDEAEKLRQRFPTLHIHRTAHKWYCAAHGRTRFFLAKIRHEKGGENVMDEQKRATAEMKRKATYARKREREAARRNDRIRAIEVAREIRDNPNSSSTDKLKAVMLLRELKA